MNPQVATLLCFAGIAFLFWADRGRASEISRSVWLPTLWMLFAGSRMPSQWWSLGPPTVVDMAARVDGSPMDRNVFLIMIAAAVYVLIRRRIEWKSFLSQNLSFLIFIAFASMSILWADEPFLAFKRLIKSLGDVLMVLIVLTEKRPFDALGVILRKLAFILLPLSILFIKYYPELGRDYHMSEPMFTGVGFQKNALGQLCMIIAVYFAWLALLRRRSADNSIYSPPLVVFLIVSAMLFWLLMMAQSATALALTVGATATFAIASASYFANRPGRLVAFGVAATIIIPVLEYSFQIKNSIILLLGRRPDLTDRLPLWEAVLQAVPNVWVGAGFESFWTADRLIAIGSTQAHNGYIDLYASLGLIGVFLLLIAVIVGFLRALSQLRDDYALAVFRMAIIIIALVYNYTEASFKPMNNVYIMLLFGILTVPVGRMEAGTRIGLSRTRGFDQFRPSRYNETASSAHHDGADKRR